VPSGAVVEFGHMPMLDSIDRFVSPTGVRFVTGDQGMGHMTIAVANYQDTVDFYIGMLGFSQRETIDKMIQASFSSPNPRQHSVALIDGHGENHFHHFMVEVDSIDDVGRCLDRVMKGEAKLTVGLGRHFNDLMTSFYMASPSGVQVEYGYDGRRVDPDLWVENTQGGVGGASLWGHHPVESAHHESVASGFKRVDA
jgi:3,4-dihydroxy-9,10-secoandrosta-1,3,5(10)-triene-9,17-dione 4,5-dioxygenase